MFERLQQELAKRSAGQGITIIDAMGLPDPLDAILKLMMRSGSLTSSMLAAKLDLTHAQARLLGELMVEKGLVIATEPDSEGEVVYRVRFAHARQHKLPPDLLESLEDG